MTNEELARDWLYQQFSILPSSGFKVAELAALLTRVQAEAILAEHKSHVAFESELYATLVDPVAEGSIKEAEMRKQLLEQARWYRQRVYELEGSKGK